MTRILLFSVFIFSSCALLAQKTWTGAMDATWANAGNWMPTGVPSSTDEVLFNNAASNTVSSAAATSVGQIKVSNNTTLSLKSSVTASIDLTITGASGDDLVVESGSTLNITSTSNVATEQIIQIVVPTLVTASISGNMGFSNTGTAKIDHRLLATDVSSVVFQSGSVFTAGLGFGGYAFGTNVSPAYSVTFKNGSRYISTSGSTPLGLSDFYTVAYFESGSTYQHDQTHTPTISQRRYGNFEYTKIVGNQTAFPYIIDGNLTIKSGGGATLNRIGGATNLIDLAFFSTTSEYKVAGDLIIEDGGSLTLGTGTSVTCFIVKGNVIVKSGGTLKLGTQSSVNLLCISGNLLVESGGSLIIGGGTSTNSLFLRGGYGTQTITNNSSTSSGTFSKLYLRSQQGVDLGSNLEVQDLEFYQYNNFDVAFGSRILLANYDLKVNGNITGALNNNRYVQTLGTGKLKRPVGTTPVLFPVSTGELSDFVTLVNTGTPDEFSVNVKPYFSANVNIMNRIWNIDEGTVGGSNVTIVLHPQTEYSPFIPSTVVLGHGNPNGTFNALPATYVPDALGGTLTANSVTTFSPFIIANDVALGVTLTNFSAQWANKNTVMLNWQTENEKDNSGFEVQRSSDAKNWSNIGFVKGKGQSSVAYDYTFEDKGTLSILTYYRLKQVDFDGKEHFSKVVNVSAKKNNVQFSVFPNPIKSKSATLDVHEDLMDGTLIVTNTVGSVVKKQTINSKTLTLDLSTLTNGLYIFEIQKGVNRYFEKVLVAE